MCFISTLLELGGLEACIYTEYVIGRMLLHWGMECIDIWIYRARRRAFEEESKHA